MKRRAAGDEQAERRHRRQEIRGQRRRVQQVLEIVEHQQRGLIRARGPCALRQVDGRHVRQPERLGDRRRDECSIPKRSE
jgi:hypothetical protein